MPENPYKSSQQTSQAVKTRPNYWLINTGMAVLLLSVFCLGAMVFGMVQAFDAVSSSPATTSPSSLASNIGFATLPSLIAAPLAILGIVLVVVGFVVRRPAR